MSLFMTRQKDKNQWNYQRIFEILTLSTFNYAPQIPFFFVLILSILFTMEPTNLKTIFLKKHNQTSINLANVFDQWQATSLSIFLNMSIFCLNVSVSILMIYKWSKIRVWFTFWLNINEIQLLKYIAKNCSLIFLYFLSYFLSFLGLTVNEMDF